MSEADLTRYGRALTGVAFGVPPGITRWRPLPSAERNLRHLHRAGIQLADARSGTLADGAAAHGLEQQPRHALVDCMGVEPIYRETPAARRHRDILAQLETLLQVDLPQSAAELCAAVGVSGRLVRACCKEHLGIALNRHTRLYRMQQVRAALRQGNPKSIKISKVAGLHRFRDPGRFASEGISLCIRGHKMR